MVEMNRVSRFFVNRSAARRAARAFEWVRSEVPIPPASHCLEIGCGNASFAARFVEGFQPAEYVGTDLDPHQLDAARVALARRFPNGIPPVLALRPASMLDLPFGAGSFDIVLAFVAIHHASHHHRDFSEVPRALAELDRVLQPGGALVYQEILHRAAIRHWLTDHAYRIERYRSRWRFEFVAARKPSAAPEKPPAGTPSGT